MNPELREELLRLVATDQHARRRLDEHPRLTNGVPEEDLSTAERQTLEQLLMVDAGNTTRMKEVLAAHGWPGYALVGSDGAEAAWLLVQHADRDPAFQRRCLELLSEAVRAGDADAGHEAYLTDRVLVAEGKQQVYGTQFRMTGDGALEPQPLADPDQVDVRRRQVGLGSLEEYRKLLADRRSG
ncbi:DUF6624 domain-containing protein [Kribbella sp. NPDC059898]|uniref:DUF6624 domain-containing protein n=1 Tax=Kribbella sp. NPDC059898 TaxID=3346995 RepID=UPI0036540FC3